MGTKGHGARIGLIIKQQANVGVVIALALMAFAVVILLLQHNTRRVSAAPFECSPVYYQSVGDSNTALARIDIANNTSSHIRSSEYTYNALGYDPADNYMYAIRQGDPQQLLRVHSDGPIEVVRNLSPTLAAGEMWRAGDMDDSRNLWAYRWSGTAGTEFARVSVVDGSTDLVTFANPNNIDMQHIADFVYQDGKLYGIGGPQNAGVGGNYLYTLDVASQTLESAVLLDAGELPGENYGAGWVTSDNHLYFLNNYTGAIYEIVNYQNPGTAGENIAIYQVASAGSSAAANDGASCRNAPTMVGFVPGEAADGFTGNPTDPGEITNDSVLDTATNNGKPGVGTEDVTLQIKDDINGDPLDGGLTGVSVNPDGTFTIPNNATPGDYEVTYEMCDRLRPAIPCNEGTAVLRVAGYVNAGDDNFSDSPFLSHVGGTTSTVLANDNELDKNGEVSQSLAGSSTVQLEIKQAVGPSPNQDILDFVSFNDGQLVVSAGAPAGTHQIEYEVCENFYPSEPSANPCDTAIITLLIQQWAALDLETDTFTVGQGGATNLNVFTNDTVGEAAASAGNTTGVSITNDGDLNGVAISDSGNITVPAGTLPGVYDVEYEVCEAAFPANCAQSTAKITVEPDVLVITDKEFSPIPGRSGGTTDGSVLDGATLGGQPVESDDVEINITDNGGLNGVTVTDTGAITVPADTEPGTYEVGYEVCEAQYLPDYRNCETATATIVVSETPIVANNDSFTGVNGNTGNSTVGNILANDRFNGEEASSSEVTISVDAEDLPAGVSIAPSGVVSVAPGTAPGTHSIPYQICETTRATNCDTAVLQLEIQDLPGVVEANNDTFGPVVDGLAGNVFANDTHNSGTPTEAAVIVTKTGGSEFVTINPDGSVMVAPSTPAGEHTVTYQLCERAHSSNCDTATVTVAVAAKQLVVNNDSFGPVVGHEGGTGIGNVLANDTLGGDPAEVATVELEVTSADDGVSLDTATGEVSVAPGTPAGTYEIAYTACEILNPSNCHAAIVEVEVRAADVNAGGSTAQNPVAEGPAGNVFDGATLEGDPINSNDVTVNITDDDGLTGVVVDDEGNVIVPQDTPAGTYEVEYEICEVINPANCDSSTMEIVVLQSVVVARDDRFAPVSEVTGGTAGNLLENDTINDIVTGGERVNLTIDGTLPEGITVDLATGDVQVAPGTPAGSYEIRYQVCHVANPTMCDTATAMITVAAAPVTEEDDATEEVGGGSIGAPNSGFAAQAGSWILVAPVGISLLAMMAFGARRRYLRSVQVRK